MNSIAIALVVSSLTAAAPAVPDDVSKQAWIGLEDVTRALADNPSMGIEDLGIKTEELGSLELGTPWRTFSLGLGEVKAYTKGVALRKQVRDLEQYVFPVMLKGRPVFEIFVENVPEKGWQAVGFGLVPAMPLIHAAVMAFPDQEPIVVEQRNTDGLFVLTGKDGEERLHWVGVARYHEVDGEIVAGSAGIRPDELVPRIAKVLDSRKWQ